MGINGVPGVNNDDILIKKQEIIEEVQEELEANGEEQVQENKSPSTAFFNATDENEFIEMDDAFDTSISAFSLSNVSDPYDAANDEEIDETEKESENPEIEDPSTNEDQEKEGLDLVDFETLVSSNKELKKLSNKVGIGALFDKLDTDHDGEISSDELQEAGINDGDIDSLKASDLTKYLSDSFKTDTKKTNSKATSKKGDSSKADTTSSTGSAQTVSSGGGVYSSGGSTGSYGGSPVSSGGGNGTQVSENKTIDEQIQELKQEMKCIKKSF